MSPFPILALFLCVVTIGSAADVSTERSPTFRAMSVTPTFCPPSTYAKCEPLFDRLWKRRRENTISGQDICRCYEEIIGCYLSLKVIVACEEDLQLNTDLMVTNARINDCEVHDLRIMVDASEDAPTSYRNTIAVAAILTIVITGFLVFAFRNQLKKHTCPHMV